MKMKEQKLYDVRNIRDLKDLVRQSADIYGDLDAFLVKNSLTGAVALNLGNQSTDVERGLMEVQIKNKTEESVVINGIDFVNKHRKGIAEVAAVAAVATGVGVLSKTEVKAENINPQNTIIEKYPSEIPSQSMTITLPSKEATATMETAKSFTGGVFTIGSRFYEVDGQAREGETVTILYKGMAVGPIRFIGGALGIEDKNITLDSKTNVVTLKKGNTTFKLKLNTKDYWVNGVKKTSNVEAIVKDGRTLVPFRIITEAFGGTMLYYPGNGMIFVNYNDGERKDYFDRLKQEAAKAVEVGQKYAQTDLGAAAFAVEPYTKNGVMFTGEYRARKTGTDLMANSLIPATAKNLDKTLGVEFFYGSDKVVYGFGPEGVYLMSKDGKGIKLEVPAAFSTPGNMVKAIENKTTSGICVVDKSGKILAKYKTEVGTFVDAKQEQEYASRKVLYDEMQKIIVGNPNVSTQIDNDYLGIHTKFNYVNVLHFDKADVENYLKTGTAKGFQAIKDENGVDVAIKMKNEFGFGKNEAAFDQAIDWLRTNDSARFDRMVENCNFFCSNWGVYGLVEGIGSGTWDDVYRMIAVESTLQKEWGQVLSIIYTESIAIEKSNLGWSGRNGGIEKGKQLIEAAKDWLNKGLISQNDYINFENFEKITIDYYNSLK